ncbi:hypothetical protein HanRHA438_Chr12g0565921 [Helianthus annuus]|uniref:Uncharacterized protein n=1 Tax=Helianthus annuus TaxID=4232 RepID=A0A9K3MXL6_HELAN|nr:hypothetical protein HanXRQr2_Chr12g0554561 [Helianthus annuus]KAJ0490364.1 hypothetical protein HanHA300_Chr12g0454601 [Helianthus annuus]KAJ0494544.1 hypothetical protein HanIR_Chr12g0598671 [Helianthus annuus]KAJ0506282.1 hypothetical protein HanHA89_Chr12g0480181 [Helianthus annuus]KAJ0675954.1 hypothetical protein HanLR1_Chr12g0457101 [Helianthus annuus]
MLVGSSIIANEFMEDYNVLACREEETIRLRAEAEAMVKAAREGAEQLEREKAAFEKLKQTERWAASAGLEKVRTLAKLLSDERKLWKEACAEAAAKEAKTRGATALKEAQVRAAKVLADADADRIKLNKVVEELQAELKSRASILEEATARATEAEVRARQAEEERDGLSTSLAQVTEDQLWMR